MKYYTKKIEISAVQIKEEYSSEWPSWLLNVFRFDDTNELNIIYPSKRKNELLILNTYNDGYCLIEPGDWIINNPITGLETYNDDTFKLLYEL